MSELAPGDVFTTKKLAGGYVTYIVSHVETDADGFTTVHTLRYYAEQVANDVRTFPAEHTIRFSGGAA